MVWELVDIIAYLEKYKICVVCRKGVPELVPPEGQGWRIKVVLPHVRARRAELIAHYMPPDEPAIPPPQTHDERLQEVESRGNKAGRKVFVLDQSGLVHEVHSNRRKELRAVVATCKYACVEGDPEWTQLPTPR